MSPGDEILTLLQTTTIDMKEFEREAACLPPDDGERDGGWTVPIRNDYLLGEMVNVDSTGPVSVSAWFVSSPVTATGVTHGPSFHIEANG